MSSESEESDAGADLRHSGTTRTGPYDMNAAFMLLQEHGWDIHAVTSGAAGAERQSRQRAGNTRAPRATARPTPPAQDQPKPSGICGGSGTPGSGLAEQ